MKHKEIEVWVKDNQTFSDGTPIISMKEQHGYSKAKLIIPVEPEVIAMELDLTKVDYITLVDCRFIGRRWKCRFEEIVE